MKEIQLQELKQLQLDILIQVADYCDNNNLDYFLAGGTLIGAIRHKGYIPWDDDIDIMMPREDYNKLILTFNGKIRNLVLDAPELHLDYYAPYANVFDNRTILVEEYLTHRKVEIGVKIDIFPVDDLPFNTKLWPGFYAKSAKYNFICDMKNYKLGFYSGLVKFKMLIRKMLYFPLPFSLIQREHIDLLRKSNELSDGVYSDFIVFPVYGPKPFENAKIFPLVLVEFEGHLFKAPRDYNSYLINIYGDYMKLPPVEKRVAHHYFKAYWK